MKPTLARAHGARSGAAADDPGLHGLIPLLREEMNLILRDSSHTRMNNKGYLRVCFVQSSGCAGDILEM